MSHTLLTILPFLLFGGQILAQLGGHFKINVTTRDSGAPGSGCIILAQLPTSTDPLTDAITAMKPICPPTAPNPSAADDQRVEWPLSSDGDGAESSLAIFGDLPGGDGDTSRPGCIMKLSQMQVAYLLGRDLQWNSSVGEVWDFTGVGTLLDPLSFAVMECQSTQPPMAEHLNLPNPNAHKSDSSIWWTSLTVAGLGDEVEPTLSQSPATTTHAADEEGVHQTPSPIDEDPASTTSFRFIDTPSSIETPTYGSESEDGQVEPTDIPALTNNGTSTPSSVRESDGQSTGSGDPRPEPTNPTEILTGDTTSSHQLPQTTIPAFVTTDTVVSEAAETTAILSLPHKEVIKPSASITGGIEEPQPSDSENSSTPTVNPMEPASGSNTTSSSAKAESGQILGTSFTSPTAQLPGEPTRGPIDNQPNTGVDTTMSPDPPMSAGSDSDDQTAAPGTAPTDLTDDSGLATGTGIIETSSSPSSIVESTSDRTNVAAPTREVPIQVSIPVLESASLDSSSSALTPASPTAPGSIVLDPSRPTTAPLPSQTAEDSTSGFMIAISTVNKAKETIISLSPNDDSTLDVPTSSMADSIDIPSTPVSDSSSSRTSLILGTLSTASLEVPSTPFDGTGGTSRSDSSTGYPDLTSIIRPIVPTIVPQTTPQSSDFTSSIEFNAIPTAMESDIPVVTTWIALPTTSSPGSQAMCCDEIVPLEQRDMTTVTYTATTTCVPCATDYIGTAQISGAQPVTTPEHSAAASTSDHTDAPSGDLGNVSESPAEFSDEAIISAIETTQFPESTAKPTPNPDPTSDSEDGPESEVSSAEINPTLPPPPSLPTPTTSPFDVPTFDPAAPFRELGFFPFSSSLRLSQRQRGGGYGRGTGRGGSGNGNGYRGGGAGNWGDGGYAGDVSDDSSRQEYVGQEEGVVGSDYQSEVTRETGYLAAGTGVAGSESGQESDQASGGNSVATDEPTYEETSSEEDNSPSQQLASTYRETSTPPESVSTRSSSSSSASSHISSALTRPSVTSTMPRQTTTTSSIGHSNAAQSQNGDSVMNNSSPAEASSGAGVPTSSDRNDPSSIASTDGPLENTSEPSPSSSSSSTPVPTTSIVSSVDDIPDPVGGINSADTEIAAIPSPVPSAGSQSSASNDKSSSGMSSSTSEEQGGSTASTRSFLASPSTRPSTSGSASDVSSGGAGPTSVHETTPSIQHTAESPTLSPSSSIITSISSSRSSSQEMETVPSSSQGGATSSQHEQASVPSDGPSRQQSPPSQTSVARSTSADRTTPPSDTPSASTTSKPSTLASSSQSSSSSPPTEQDPALHTEFSTNEHTFSPESSSEQSLPPTPSEQPSSPSPTDHASAPPTSEEVHESSSSATSSSSPPPPAPSPENQPPPSPTDELKPEESPSPAETHQDPTPSSPVFTDAGITIAQFITSVLPDPDEHSQDNDGDSGGEEGGNDVTTIGQFTPTGDIPGLAQATQTLAAIKRKMVNRAGTNRNVQAASAGPNFDVSQRPAFPHRRRRQARWRGV